MTEDEAERAIDRAFPELAPCAAVLLGHGVDNAAFLVNGAWVFRFPRTADAIPYLTREIAHTPHLAPRLPIAISSCRWVCRDPLFAGHAYLAGETAESRDGAPFAAQLGAFFRALHAIPAEENPGVPDLAGKSDPERVLTRLDRWTAASPSRPAILELAARLARAPADRAPCWVHGDLYPRHLVIAHGAIAGVIDWGDLHIGDRALDLSIAFGWLDDTTPFFDTYGPIDDATRDRARLRALSYGVFFACVADDAKLRALGERYLARLID